MNPQETADRVADFQRLLSDPAVLTRIHRRMAYVLRGQFRIMRRGRLDDRGRRMAPLAGSTRKQRQARGKPVGDQHPELLSLWDAFLRPSKDAVLTWNPKYGRVGTTSKIYPYHHAGNSRLPRRRLLGIMKQPYDTAEKLKAAVAAQLKIEAERVGLEMEAAPMPREANESAS